MPHMDYSPRRQPKILWASTSCLLDISGGAVISVRQILKTLAGAGYEVGILGATIFTLPAAAKILRPTYERMRADGETAFIFRDGPLTHHLLVTKSLEIGDFCTTEQIEWFTLYIEALEDFRPDLVFFDGGLPFDYLIPAEARVRGIPSACYITHPAFTGTRWAGDVDVLITDSVATSRLYEKTTGLRPIPVGKFVDPTAVVAKTHRHERVTFVNPSLHKGATIVVMLAVLLEDRRPDIVFEIVGSQESWRTTVAFVTASLGSKRETLRNVVETPHCDDMRPVYGRSRALIAPSLWFESGARVLVEAMLNGIPTLSTASGGMPENAGDGGIVFSLPDRFFEEPYDRVPTSGELAPLIADIERLFDDEDFYADLSRKALNVARSRHNIATNTQRLIDAFHPLLAVNAGDRDFSEIGKRWHKHGVPVIDNFFEPAPPQFQNTDARSDGMNPDERCRIPLELGPDERGLFIDCGGFDGCSAVKFLMENPKFDCITFEPNRTFWPYYENVPTKLIGAAVYIYDGRIPLRIDTRDGDGSSILSTKKIDYWGEIANEEFPTEEVDCFDIVPILRGAVESYDRVVLKLDIEGAEYDILEAILDAGLAPYIAKLYCEFHWDKCGIPVTRHEALIAALDKVTCLCPWDAMDLAIHGRPPPAASNRATTILERIADPHRHRDLVIPGFPGAKDRRD